MLAFRANFGIRSETFDGWRPARHPFAA